MNPDRFLMLIVTVGTFLVLYLLIFFTIPEKNIQVFLSIASFMLGYYFGSSARKGVSND